jgi:hypothetical protein
MRWSLVTVEIIRARSALQVSVEVLVSADRQQFDGVLIRLCVGQSAKLLDHFELEDTNARKVADLGVAYGWVSQDRPNGIVEVGLLIFMEPLERA